MIDFITKLSISTDWKPKTYNLTLVIINLLIEIIYHKLIKVIINTFKLAKII